MAVTAIALINDGRHGEESYQPDGTTVTTRARQWRVTTDAATDDDVTVMAYGSLPNIGASHPSHSSCRCSKRSCRPESSGQKKHWLFSAEYTTKWDIRENPLSDPAETEWSTESYQTEVFVDIDGNAIVNSAGDPFDPTLEKDDSRWSSVTRKNVVVTVPDWFFAYQDSVNSDSYTMDGVTITAGWAKVSAIHLSKVQERNAIQYRVLTVTIHYRGENEALGSASGSLGSGSGGDEIEPWHLNILDAGFRELQSGELANITDKNGDAITAPAPLDGSGVALDPPTPATAIFRQFQVYHEKAFARIESMFS
jgi:hypothetical protein